MADKSMLSIKRLSLTAVMVGLVIAILPAISAPVESADAKLKENFNPNVQLIESMKDGEAFINQMHKAAESLSDYSLVYETRIFKKGSTLVETGNLFFKKPKLMRVEETGEYSKGSVAVIGKDGKARAHSGGITSFITVTMDPEDKQLNSPNGDRMEDSDFASLARILKERLKGGARSRVTEKPVAVAGVPEPTYVVEVFLADKPNAVIKRIFVHPTTHLPVRWDDYDYKEPCLSLWKNVKTNVGLSDDLFKL